MRNSKVSEPILRLNRHMALLSGGFIQRSASSSARLNAAFAASRWLSFASGVWRSIVAPHLLHRFV